jgi:hypothetical protein
VTIKGQMLSYVNMVVFFENKHRTLTIDGVCQCLQSVFIDSRYVLVRVDAFRLEEIGAAIMICLCHTALMFLVDFVDVHQFLTLNWGNWVFCLGS